MSAVLSPRTVKITLPSDQDATGRTFGPEEVEMVTRALASGTLTCTKGQFTKQFEQRFAQVLGAKHAHACASGSAAVHLAVAAIDPEPGDEIVTTAITDMGALTPILYQGAIPRFAEVDPRTWNVTAATIEPCMNERTKAIIVTHLFGNPCDMEEIKALADRHRLPIIEDCAQAFLATHAGRKVGTWGTIGCFSLQQGKHITTGEGGIVVTDDAALARKMYLYINKAWGYGDPNPDHYFLALNYRLSELQGAVALAQMDKLSFSVESRQKMADLLTRKIDGIPGVHAPYVDPRSTHVYWKYCLRVDGAVVKGGAVGLAKRLKEDGIASAPRYIQKPAFACEIFQKQKTLGTSRWPFTLARPEAVDYRKERFPLTYQALEEVLVLPWNERYTAEHVDYIAACLAQSVRELS
jgi:dTDP-4-amino-4,6-dideoxygalactose transaminase